MAFHVISRLADSRSLTPTLEAARQLSRTVMGFAGNYDLVLLGSGGDHLHAVTLGNRQRAGRLTRAMEAAITRVCGHDPGFRPGRILPVQGPDHMEELVDYTLGQAARHRLDGDLLLESTNVLDLMSIRMVDTRCAGLLHACLPGIRSDDLLEHLGGPVAVGTDPSRAREAARVVTGGLDFLSRRPLARRARQGAVRFVRSVGLGFAATGELLGVSGGAVARAMAVQDPQMDRAIGLAAGLLQRNAPGGLRSEFVLPATVTWTRPVVGGPPLRGDSAVR